MQTVDVIIVGAGAAGLAAAKKLKEAKKTFLILEARGRIGGRAHTVWSEQNIFPESLAPNSFMANPRSPFSG
jgi:monoamine oxidase